MSGDGVAGEFSPKLGLYVMYVIGNLMKGFSIETKNKGYFKQVMNVVSESEEWPIERFLHTRF